MPRRHSIRSFLLRDQIVLILVLGLALLGATFVATGAVRTLSRSLIEQAVDQTEAELDGFFAPADQALRTMASWSDFAPLDLEGGVALRRLLGVFLRQNPQFSQTIVADESGRALSIRLGQEGLVAEQVADFRARPWYVGAVGRAAAGDSSVFWTEPYEFRVSGDHGLTASIAVDRGEEGLMVVALDVRLEDLHEFIRSTEVSENGGIAVLTMDNRLVAISDQLLFGGDPDPDAVLLRPPLELGTPLITAAATAFARRGDITGSPILFSSERRQWWGQIRLFDLAPDRQLAIAVLVPNSDLLGDRQQIRLWIIVATLLVVLAAVRRASFFSRRLSSPIEELVRRSDAIARGDLEDPGPLETRLTDVRVLSEAQDRMRTGLRSLLRLERDLQLARQIQQSTFPKQLPAMLGFDLEAWSEPAEETGGDTYDVIGYSTDAGSVVLTEVDAEHAVLLLADATGHGIGPALSVTQVRAMLRMAVRAQESLASLAEHLNGQLYADLPGNRFITAWLGVLEADGHRLTSFSAGQGPLLYYRAATDEVEILSANAPPLGLFPQIPVLVPPPIEMSPGDLFVVLSDGFYEAENEAGEEFETERVVDVVRQNRHRSAAEIVEALRTAVDSFTEHAPFTDDRTAVVVKRT